MPALRYAVIALAIVAMLWPSAPPKARGALAGSEWRIIEVDGAKVSGAGTVRFTQATVRGKATCNAFFGAFRDHGGMIEIGGLNTTRMMCEGRMELEQSLLNVLGRVRAYRLEGSWLDLVDAEGKTVMRLAG